MINNDVKGTEKSCEKVTQKIDVKPDTAADDKKVIKTEEPKKIS